MNKRVTFISIFVMAVLFFTGSYISDKNPFGSKSITNGKMEQQKPHIEQQRDDATLVYTDHFDGANDTTALKARGYIIGRGPGAGPR